MMYAFFLNITFLTLNIISFHISDDVLGHTLYWCYSEMRKYSSPETPFIIVGLQTDIRSKAQADGSDISKFVTFNEGLKEAGILGASDYLECSAKNNTGVKRVLEKAAQIAVHQALPAELKRSSCSVS